ncbi:hypothetical protein HY494_02070 [Candidatus Woesearchaeota archaeon]|nr:hypothetical protein [Candidatus Woesearchaeota archaeon]
MKKIILILGVLIFINSVYAQEVCEYSGIKTEYGYNYQTPGEKSEYGDEQFVHLMDAKAIKDLGQLKGLTCLEYGDFYNQGITGNIDNLRDLVNLKALSLHTNPEISGDVCVFSKATKLKSLKLAFDEKIYGGISCLKDLNLETFAMTYTKISGDLSDLSHMTNLKALYLSGADVTGDISALSGLINLEELTLADAEADGSKFYGDLASLDNLKKLRRVALYNIDVTNCGHFHKVHPEIEGGCSDESKSTVVNTNIESEKMIGKGPSNPMGAPRYDGDKGAPPEECIVNQQFMGEEKCRALVDKKTVKGGDKPPEECIVSGKFIGEDKCRDLMDKTAPSEKTESPERVIKKSFLQKVIDWFRLLFN